MESIANSDFVARAVARKGHAERTLQLLRDTLDVLRDQFEDEEVNEIMINGPHDV